MKSRCFLRGAAALTVILPMLAGCDSTGPEGKLVPEKPADQVPPEQAKIDQQKFMDGMKGQYKGAPK